MRLIAVAAFCAVLGAVSLGSAAPLDALVTNTLTLTDSNDATTQYRFSDDGLFTRFPVPDAAFALHDGPFSHGTIFYRSGVGTSAWSDNLGLGVYLSPLSGAKLAGSL